MNTIEIETICTSDPLLLRKFGGVYARDCLPHEPSADFFYICNTAPSTHPGVHWVLIYRNSSRHVEYFDSLGSRPIHQDIEAFLGDEYYTVTGQTQDSWSSLCGHYCLFYISLRVRGMPMNDIMTMLYNSGSQSDNLVATYIWEIYQFKCDFQN